MEFIQNLIDSYPLMTNIFWFLIIFISLYIFRKLLLNRLYKKLKDSGHWYETQKFARWINSILLFLLFIFIFGNELSGITTAIGFAGAGVTYALREVIVSIAGWFAILFADFFNAGDRILLGGIKGDVVDISILRTTLMEVGEWVGGDQYTGRKVRVSNSYIFTSPVYNYTSSFQFLWDEITIPLSFESDFALTEDILFELADKHTSKYNIKAKKSWNQMRRHFKVEDASLDNQVYLSLNENTVEISLRYVVYYQERRAIKNRLYTDIFKRFKKEDSIEIMTDTIEVTNLE